MIDSEIAETASYIQEAMQAVEKAWQTFSISDAGYWGIMQMLGEEMTHLTEATEYKKEAE